ncbi:hypothetical protein [Paraburkholderia ferrariae]|uniref:hypothetical protein n=1 Tax=Paraburkholderia ferrariae TaxID=386056 RepID=UPI0004869CE0|nr:hypothetical protein [Paraburkholderia ferrariae]
MTQIRKLLTGAALTVFAAAFAHGALAQGADPGAQMPSQAPAAAGVAQPAPAPQNLTAPGPTDPLVQKRNADAQANTEYRQAKKEAKSQYKAQVKDAKINRKADRQAADYEMKSQMQGQSAQQPGGSTEH